MDRDRPVAAIARRDQREPAFAGRHEALLLVAWPDAIGFGLDPDLQEMHRLRFRVVELAVLDARPRAHALHLARADHRAVAEAVLVLKRAFENVGDDLHIVVGVAGEAAAGRDAVVVDDA